jgi:hypothetical protein
VRNTEKQCNQDKSTDLAEKWKKRESWDFEWIKNGDQAEACFLYEIGRHVPSFSRPNGPRPGFVDSDGNYHTLMADGDGCVGVTVPADYPERSFKAFAPKVLSGWNIPPIQELTFEELAAEHKHSGASWRLDEEALRYCPDLNEWMIEEIKSESEQSLGKENEELGKGHNPLNEPLMVGGNIVERIPSKNVILKIFTSYSKTRILKEFKRWLDLNIPRDIAKKETGKSKLKKYQALLKKLGAFRLLKEFSPEEARDHLKECRAPVLFDTNPDWYSARTGITKILQDRFHTMVCKKCGMEVNSAQGDTCPCGSQVFRGRKAEATKIKPRL